MFTVAGQSSHDIVRRFSLLFIAAALLSCLLAARALASDNEYAAPLTAFAQDKVAAWIADPALIAAVKAQNAKTGSLDEAAIKQLDTEWRGQVGQGATPLIDSVVGNALSDKLRQWKDETGGMVTEIFVMDAVGLNVGASDVTSDYWQGDEAKWQETACTSPLACVSAKCAAAPSLSLPSEPLISYSPVMTSVAGM